MAPGGPTSEIGRPRPRSEARRLIAGRGRYTGDENRTDQLHACFLRSPYPHASILKIDREAAIAHPGVAAVLLWDDLAPVCKPWRTVSKAFPGLQSPDQYPLACGRVSYQGEPVALVLARSRAVAEDAAELIDVTYAPQPAMADYRQWQNEDTPLAHPELKDNIAWSCDIMEGDFDKAFAAAALVVEDEIVFTRHTGVPLEPRSILAEFDETNGGLSVRISHQMPHQLQLHLADFLHLPMSSVRVTTGDVGGGFGIKMHVYSDEVAICAAARLMQRPIKFVADRIESMVADVHAREHVVRARMALDASGHITAFDIHDLHGLGAYSVYPRSSTMETLMALRPIGAAYHYNAYRARADVILQNKSITGQYRSVGHPIATTVTERLVDRAAHALGLDPLEFRRANYVRPQDMPMTNPAGLRLLDLSHEACLDRLVELIDYTGTKAKVASESNERKLLGLGFAAFVEMTASGAEAYGRAGVQVAAVDSVSLMLEPDGSLKASASVCEIGQGIGQGLRQIIAQGIGISPALIALSLGDTATSPHGGGAWSSRGAAIGGEAAWGAALKLRNEILNVAGALLQCAPDTLDIVCNTITDASGAQRITLRELAETVYFRGYELPKDMQPQLSVAHSYRREQDAAIPTNGIQASLVEVDTETGLVRCLKHWVVEDCGRIINPLMVDEQIRGGVAQGIGAALFEACRYDAEGQYLTGTLADYLLPMAGEMPDIVIAHVETPYSGSAIGAKGAGEAGTCAAGAAVLNAINDALARRGASLSETPATPQLVLHALDNTAPEPLR